MDIQIVFLMILFIRIFSRYIAIAVIAVLLTGFLTGCDYILDAKSYIKTLSGPEHITVARRFWDATLSEEPKTALKFMASNYQALPDLPGYDSRATAVLGDVTAQDGHYFIDTTLVLYTNGNVLAVPIMTAVIHENDQWKVDYLSSAKTVIDVSFERSIDSFVQTVELAGQVMPIIYPQNIDLDTEIETLSKRLNSKMNQGLENVVSTLRDSVTNVSVSVNSSQGEINSNTNGT